MRKTKKQSWIRRALAGAVVAGTVATTLAMAATPATAAPEGAKLANSSTGTRIEFHSMTPEDLFVDGRIKVEGFGETLLKGRSSDGDDVRAVISDTKGNCEHIFAHNPWFSEAYVQFGGRKVHDREWIHSGGLFFSCNYTGDHNDYKCWTIECYGSRYPYNHKFIHSTNYDDGVKGTIFNASNHPMTLKFSGRDEYVLKPSEKLLFFDANYDIKTHHKYARGITFTVTNHKGESAEIELGDPTVGMAFMWSKIDGKSQLNHIDNSETVERGGSISTVTYRQAEDHWGIPHETDESSDWPRFALSLR